MNGRSMRQHGTTLVELTIAVAIMGTVFTAVLPLFAGIRNSTEARWAGLEMVQNARVLNEFLCRHLAEARRVVGVSGPTDDRGYIEFETAAGTLCRCGMADGGDIEFGPADAGPGRAGSEPTPAPAGILAGPVEYLRFICYDGNDLARPVATAGRVRLVTWGVGWRSSNRLTRSTMTSGSCYLRVRTPVGDAAAAMAPDVLSRLGAPPSRPVLGEGRSRTGLEGTL
jgi:type II secretory pathway pseudopilin PulG